MKSISFHLLIRDKCFMFCFGDELSFVNRRRQKLDTPQHCLYYPVSSLSQQFSWEISQHRARKPHKRNLETKTLQPQHLSRIIDNSDNHKKPKPRRISSFDEWNEIFFLCFSPAFHFFEHQQYNDLPRFMSEKPAALMKRFFEGLRVFNEWKAENWIVVGVRSHGWKVEF